MRFLLRYAALCVLLSFALQGKAQGEFSQGQTIFSTETEGLPIDSTHLFRIKEITIEGAQKTRTSTIKRELSFQIDGEYPLSTIVQKFHSTKKQLMNTGLFRNVVVSLKSMQGYDVYVNIEVEERWYIYPIPHVKVVDDSFQEWWKDRNRDLDRINYGFKLTYKNFSGRNDRLSATFVNGYTKQASARYDGLFLDKALKWSAGASFSFGKKKEINYNTVANKQVFLKNTDFIHSYFRTAVDISYRRAINTKHTITVGYIKEDIADTVYRLNPKFSGKSQTLRYAEIAYRMNYFNVDFIPFPTKGYVAEIQVAKRGFSGPVNLWHLMARGSGSWHLGSKAYVNLRALGMMKLPFKQPYIAQGFMGGSDV